MMRSGFAMGILAGAVLLAPALPHAQPAGQDFANPADLGRALFHDTDLSRNRTQSCASCHDPDRAFSDPRETDAGGAVSLGDDGFSLGTRNAPAIAYARFSPRFHRDEARNYIGGQFWDGRADTLAAQAGGPPVNPIEMGMPDVAAVVARLREKPGYEAAFRSLYGAEVFDRDETAYAAMGKALEAFQNQPEFASFDSKYDRWLRGAYQLTKAEDLGRLLFFSAQFTNCNQCHQLRADPMAADETFSNYRFHNIGVPRNPDLDAANGVTDADLGLGQNPGIADGAAQRGRFKVPSLRNVAVTGPYMHNGAFKDLRTVVLFYDHFNSKASARQLNPETGAPWGAPEVEGTLSLTELQSGPALDDRRVDAIVAFLKTLTDARYEPLLKE